MVFILLKVARVLVFFVNAAEVRSIMYLHLCSCIVTTCMFARYSKHLIYIHFVSYACGICIFIIITKPARDILFVSDDFVGLPAVVCRWAAGRCLAIGPELIIIFFLFGNPN